MYMFSLILSTIALEPMDETKRLINMMIEFDKLNRILIEQNIFNYTHRQEDKCIHTSIELTIPLGEEAPNRHDKLIRKLEQAGIHYNESVTTPHPGGGTPTHVTIKLDGED